MHLSATDHTHHAFLAASYGWLGDNTAGSAHVARIQALDQEFDLETYLATLHYKDNADLQHHREGLQKAGIVEG
jgi:adenylate cyclase